MGDGRESPVMPGLHRDSEVGRLMLLVKSNSPSFSNSARASPFPSSSAIRQSHMFCQNICTYMCIHQTTTTDVRTYTRYIHMSIVYFFVHQHHNMHLSSILLISQQSRGPFLVDILQYTRSSPTDSHASVT